MTEASRTAFRIYNSSTKFIMGSKEKYVSRPDAKLSLRNNNDKQMTGELSIEGEHTFSGYVTNSDDLKVLKTNQLCESDDIIELHNSGAFSIHGKSNLIAKKGGKKISLIELENSIEKINGIERSLCYVSGESIRGDVISCNLELKKNRFSSAIKEIVLKELTAINSATPDKINIVDNISLTFNGKKKRGNFV
jgi:acyl-coenzyme A synthetase/AMP-(fatty) acid ligase